MKCAQSCLALLAAILFFAAGCTGTGTPAPATPAATPVTFPATLLPATVPTPGPTPDPFPSALSLKDPFPFGNGSTAGVGTIYRVFVNGSYSWHNDKDNRYYFQTAPSGFKYLFLFVNVYDVGDIRVWPPGSSDVRVYYHGNEYFQDPDHFLPDKGLYRYETPIEITEVQYDSQLSGSEYAGDYGYSHGSQLAYLYPGESNAMDGYIIYVVPADAALNETYAVIEFNSNDTGVWRLG